MINKLCEFTIIKGKVQWGLVFGLKLIRSFLGMYAPALFTLYELLTLSFLICKNGTHLLHCCEHEMSGYM